MTTLTSSDVLALVERIRPIVEEHATEGELNRQLSPAVYDAFRDSGLLRLAIPASYGGLEVDPVTAIGVFEALGAIDGSAAWVLNQQYAVSLLASWVSTGIDEFFADPDAYWSGVFWPPGSAERVDGGYRISARVGFASGCTRADWFLAPAVVMADGEPVLSAATGQPDFLVVILRMAELEVVDTWHTLGMRATGSNDVIISEVFVPEHRVARPFELVPRPAALADPMYGMVPWPAIHAHAAVPLGIAKGAFAHAVEVARTKVPNFMQVALKDKEVVQDHLARARGMLEGASAYLRSAMVAAMSAAEPGGGGVDTECKVSLQLAANQAATAAEDAMRLVQRTMGTSTVRDEAGMGRRFRDLSSIVQHTSVSAGRWESTGKVMFGLESDWFPFNL
jgi:alkylation response protein AidB-like acyl-CoA dehydrogenase